MTRDDLIAAHSAALIAAFPTNVTLSSTSLAPALNAGLGVLRYANDTVDPTQRPTVPHIDDIKYF